MGALHQGVCFSDTATAKADHCSKVDNVLQVASGGTTNVYTVECTNPALTATTWQGCKRLNGGACTNYSAISPTFLSCTYDGSTSLQLDYFKAIFAFLVIVWVGKQLYRKFWGDHQGI